MSELQINIKETGAEVTSQKLGQLENEIKKINRASNDSGKQLAEFEKQLKLAGSTIPSLNRSVAQTGTNLYKVSGNVQKLTGLFRTISPQLGNVSSAFGGIATAATNLGGILSGPMTFGIGAIIGLLPTLIDLFSDWTNETQELNVEIDENLLYLSRQEAAVMDFARNFSNALNLMQSARRAQRQQETLDMGLGTQDEQEAYVREAEGQLNRMMHDMDVFVQRVQQNRFVVRQSIVDGSIGDRRLLLSQMREEDRQVATIYADRLAQLRRVLDERKRILAQNLRETQQLNEDAAFEAMNPELFKERKTRSRRPREDTEARKQREALEKALNAVLGDRNALFEEGLELEHSSLEALYERLDLIQDERDYRSMILDLQRIGLDQTVEQMMLDEQAAMRNEEFAIQKIKREQQLEEQRRRAADASKKREMQQQRIVGNAISEIQGLTMDSIMLAEQEGMTRKEAFLTALDAWLKSFAIEQAFKGAENSINAIASYARYDYAAGSQFLAAAAGNFALAAAAGGASAAIPNVGVGGSGAPEQEREPESDMSDNRQMTINLYGIAASEAQVGRAIRQSLEVEDRRR